MAANQSLAKLSNAKKPDKKQPKGKKPMPKAMVAVICIVFFLLLLGGAGACVYLNVGGVTPQIIQALSGLNTEYARAAKVLDTRQAALDIAEKKLIDDQAALDKAAQAQTKAETALKARQDKLDADIKAFEALQSASPSTAPGNTQSSVKDIYSNMEAEVAAGILAKAATTQEVADILLQLDAQKAADILTAMDAKKAYEITKLMGQ